MVCEWDAESVPPFFSAVRAIRFSDWIKYIVRAWLF
jgi:hypothetical protein